MENPLVSAPYPDPLVRVLDQRFERYRILAASVERLWTGARWAEGPAWLGITGLLVFSDIPNDRMIAWSAAGGAWTFRQPTGYANGNTVDHSGRLITCEQGNRRVTRTEHNGSITVLADRFDGKPLNGPNDVVVDRDGQIWFSDPGYGIISDYEGTRAEPEQPNRIYSVNPQTGQIIARTDALTRPNGLCFSPDGAVLYAVDTGCTDDPQHHRNVLAIPVSATGSLGEARPLFDMAPGRSDGIRCDADGNIWAASGFGGPGTNGVRIFAPDGTPIGAIDLPEPAANLCFGGRRRNRLFITAGQSLYALYVEAHGL